ncbi:MAG: TIM barrel protein [Bacillota bacterium]
MENKIGIYFGFWSKDWIVDFSKYAQKADELEFDIIEYDLGAIMDSPQKNQEKLKKIVKELDIDINFCIGLPEKYNIASGDSRKRSKGIEFLKKAIRKADEFEGNKLGGIIYGAWGDSLPVGEKDKSLYMKRSADALSRVLKDTEGRKVQVNIEVVNRFEQFLINTCEEALEYLKLVNCDDLGIHLDTFHMNIEEDSFSKAIKKAGDNLKHFHIGENNRKLPGSGHLPWEEIFKALKEINYEGPIVMEPFVLPGGDIAQDVKVWRDIDPEDKDDKLKKVKENIIKFMDN